jgi:hypothetical protein
MELEDGGVPEDHEISKGDCSPFSIGDSEKQSNNVTSEGNVQSEVKLQTCHQHVAGERWSGKSPVEELKSSGSSKKKHKRKRRNHPNKKINLDRWKLQLMNYSADGSNILESDSRQNPWTTNHSIKTLV